MNFEHRAYIIKWSSVWIFVPFLFWLYNKRAPLYSAIFIPIVGITSMIHWGNNNTYDWRHIIDIFSSIVVIILLSVRLMQTDMYLCIFLLTIICSLFVIQRYLQDQFILERERKVSWGLITFIHLLFHYFIFLFAMCVHAPNVKLILLITIFIIVHTSWLYHKTFHKKLIPFIWVFYTKNVFQSSINKNE